MPPLPATWWDAVRSLPSVIDAAVVQGIPMGDGGFFGNRPIEGYATPPRRRGFRSIACVSSVRRTSGRCRSRSSRAESFEARDDVGERGFNRTILVSESFARRYWPGSEPARQAYRVDDRYPRTGG